MGGQGASNASLLFFFFFFERGGEKKEGGVAVPHSLIISSNSKCLTGNGRKTEGGQTLGGRETDSEQQA